MNYKAQIDPELRRIAWRVPYHRAMLPLANLYQAASFRLAPVPKGVAHRRFAIVGYRGLRLHVDVFEPSNAEVPLPGLLDLHGGAFSYKAAVHHKQLACRYALGANCRVFFPDYHLLPKYRYPAACQDVLALYRYILEQAQALGVDPGRIGVARDSAGGCAGHACSATGASAKVCPRPACNC